MRGRTARALLLATIAALVGTTTTHGGASAALEADPALFGDVHASRTYYSLTEGEVLEMCEYLYERGAFGAYPGDSLPCPADHFGHYFFNVSSCVAYYPGDALDPDWPSVGDVVLCESLRVRDCNAGYDAPSPETETICRRIPELLCIGEDGPTHRAGLSPAERADRDAVGERELIFRPRPVTTPIEGETGDGPPSFDSENRPPRRAR